MLLFHPISIQEKKMYFILSFTALATKFTVLNVKVHPTIINKDINLDKHNNPYNNNNQNLQVLHIH